MKDFVLSYEALEVLKEHGKSLNDIDYNSEVDLALLYYACATFDTDLTTILSMLMNQAIDITVAELMEDLMQKGKKKRK